MKFSKAEVDAIIEASPRTFVPFNKLVLSEDHQARSATAPVMSLPELAASIKDSGVLQNLVVVQAARGRYEVCAGGRRLAALTLLAQQGDIVDNYLLDPALLERLAADKLGKRAKQLLAEGWKWVDIRPRFAYDEYVKHGELRKPRRAPTPEEAEALKALDTRIAALHEQMDALVANMTKSAWCTPSGMSTASPSLGFSSLDRRRSSARYPTISGDRFSGDVTSWMYASSQSCINVS